MNRRCVYIIALIFAPLLFSSAAFAAAPNGLGITPVRQDTSVSAGVAKSGTFTVSNQTAQPITVSFSVQEFSVSDYTYNYSFRQPTDNWIKLTDGPTKFAPGESKKITYDIEVPAHASPGGYYFALAASTQVTGETSVPSTVQGTMLLNLTVNGNLIKTSVLKKWAAPRFVIGDKIPYKFDVRDTGNVYFSAYFFGKTEGLFGTASQSGTTHLLYPDATKTISDSVAAPTFPGIYKFTYGYKPDFANFEITQSNYIFYLPPWSVAALIVIALVIVWSWQNRPKAKNIP